MSVVVEVPPPNSNGVQGPNGAREWVIAKPTEVQHSALHMILTIRSQRDRFHPNSQCMEKNIATVLRVRASLLLSH